MRRGVLALAAAGLLAGCGSDKAGEAAPEPEIAKACTVRKCECVSSTIPFFFIRETRPVEWRANGDAACPEGFVLSLTGES